MCTTFCPFLSCLLQGARRNEGQTMAEYGILLAVIALIVVLAATLLGANIAAIFDATARKT